MIRPASSCPACWALSMRSTLQPELRRLTSRSRAGCASTVRLKAATTDEQRIRRWWARWPHANVAIRTGVCSGLIVVDVDPPHGGDSSLATLVKQHGELPDGRLVRTGSGGLHIYVAHPGGVVR